MKSLHINTRNNQSGMTLTEALLVLAVGALVAVLAYGGYKMATNDVKTQSQVKGTIALAAKVKQVFSTAATYTSATTDNVIKANLVPTDFKATAAVAGVGGAAGTPAGITNSWGGDIEIAGAATNFTITIESVPAEGCVEYLAGIASAGTKLTFGSGSTVVKDTAATPPVSFDAGLAAGACTAGGTAVLTVQ